jgi:hypothetical protein
VNIILSRTEKPSLSVAKIPHNDFYVLPTVKKLAVASNIVALIKHTNSLFLLYLKKKIAVNGVAIRRRSEKTNARTLERHTALCS